MQHMWICLRFMISSASKHARVVTGGITMLKVAVQTWGARAARDRRTFGTMRGGGTNDLLVVLILWWPSVGQRVQVAGDECGHCAFARKNLLSAEWLSCDISEHNLFS